MWGLGMSSECLSSSFLSTAVERSSQVYRLILYVYPSCPVQPITTSLGKISTYLPEKPEGVSWTRLKMVPVVALQGHKIILVSKERSFEWSMTVLAHF